MTIPGAGVHGRTVAVFGAVAVKEPEVSAGVPSYPQYRYSTTVASELLGVQLSTSRSAVRVV
jgi:hypothetical protein